MAVPVLSVGDVLTASFCNTWFTDIVRQKPTDEGPITTTTLQNDNDLILPLAANSAYELEGYLAATGGVMGNGDIKLGFTGPAGVTYRFTTTGYHIAGTPPATGNSASLSSGTASAGVNGGSASPVDIKGWVTTSSTSGNFTLQWAENTGNATGTTVLAGSRLKVRRIG